MVCTQGGGGGPYRPRGVFLYCAAWNPAGSLTFTSTPLFLCLPLVRHNHTPNPLFFYRCVILFGREDPREDQRSHQLAAGAVDAVVDTVVGAAREATKWNEKEPTLFSSPLVESGMPRHYSTCTYILIL